MTDCETVLMAVRIRAFD